MDLAANFSLSLRWGSDSTFFSCLIHDLYDVAAANLLWTLLSSTVLSSLLQRYKFKALCRRTMSDVVDMAEPKSVKANITVPLGVNFFLTKLEPNVGDRVFRETLLQTLANLTENDKTK